jgi:hypothetical protein
MRVSLRQTGAGGPFPGAHRTGAATPLPLLRPDGPRAILGGHADAHGLAEPVRPDAHSLFGPRGACLARPDGPLFVADTGHHRLLVWRHVPQEDGAPADLVIGQPGFTREGRNAKAQQPHAATLNVPTSIAAADGVLAVADAWNHRVLIWHGFPRSDNQPADIVLGQADFASCLANRGLPIPRADTLNWCYGVTLADGRLMVADTGNRRVLVWDRIPERNGEPAGLVLGQADFTCRDENAGRCVGPAGMRWPHVVAVSTDGLMIADAGNNRVMVWRGMPATNGAPCNFVLGQRDCLGQEHNRAAYHPDAAALNMPYGLTICGERLVVADTANSRLVGFPLGDLAMGAPATHLAGQHGFADKGDNRWLPASRDSLCWPYGVTSCGGWVVIADSGNNRVSLCEAA